MKFKDNNFFFSCYSLIYLSKNKGKKGLENYNINKHMSLTSEINILQVFYVTKKNTVFVDLGNTFFFFGNKKLE